MNSMAAAISSSEQSMQVPRGGIALKPLIACSINKSRPFVKRTAQSSAVLGAPSAPVP